MEDNLSMDNKWQTTSTGTEVAGDPVSGGRIWLRASVAFAPEQVERQSPPIAPMAANSGRHAIRARH